MDMKVVLGWLCGIWAFGIGARYIRELLRGGMTTSLTMPGEYAWIYLIVDFVPLAVLGLLMLVSSAYDLLKDAWDIGLGDVIENDA